MGTIIRKYITTNREDLLELDQYLRDERLPTLNSYFGYSVTTGFFAEREYIIIGAPRNNHFNGNKILLFIEVYLIPSNELFPRNTIGESLLFINSDSNTKGEYFGASLLALDINNDKIDDLIIGAPYYSNEQSREIGRIYVYMSDKARNILQFYF
jgi:hypothetical protein